MDMVGTLRAWKESGDEGVDKDCFAAVVKDENNGVSPLTNGTCDDCGGIVG